MKKHSYIAIVCLLFLGCKQSNNANISSISIIQNGKTIVPIDGTVTLSKVPFDIVINASQPFDMLVNASFRDSIYNVAKSENPLTSLPQFKETATIAEVLFNVDENMYLSNESTSVWYYENEENHKFNTINKKNESYQYTRTIKSFEHLDIEKNIEVRNIYHPVFMVFLAVEKIEGSVKNLEELQRFALNISWEDDGSAVKAYQESTTFKSIISNLYYKNLPVTENTNFDAIIEEPYFFNTQEIDLLQLEKIYPNYYVEGYNYRATPAYKIKLSEDYHSIVFTTYKGDLEMESVLANYELDGLLIDSEIISYDEAAEGRTHSTSKIENKNIYTTTWVDDKPEKTTRFQIDDNGFINPVIIWDMVLNKLNIKQEEVLVDFSVEEKITPTESLILIAKVADKTEDELVIDAYLFIVNTKTGEILSKFIAKNYWHSNAMQITSIKASYNLYQIAANSETVGITVAYYGGSRVNPFTSKEVTLFMRKGDTLQPVLKDYEVYNLTEENDGNGNGFYNENSKIIEPIVTSGQEFYTLKVTDSIKEVNFENREDKAIEKFVNFEQLVFQNETYTKDTIK